MIFYENTFLVAAINPAGGHIADESQTEVQTVYVTQMTGNKVLFGRLDLYGSSLRSMRCFGYRSK